MNPAWQVRENQRQKLVERLRDQLWQLMDEADGVYESDTFCLDVVVEALLYLKADRPLRVDGPARNFLLLRALPEIESFSRIPEEKNALLAQLAEEILETPLGHIKADLLSAENSRPQEVFRAPSAMADIAFEDEEDESEEW